MRRWWKAPETSDRTAQPTHPAAHEDRGTEVDWIEREVASRKKLAEECAIRETVIQLYFESLRYYSSWVDKMPERLHPSVFDFTNVSPRTIRFRLRDHVYTFAYTERTSSLPDGEPYTVGTFEILNDDRLALKFDVFIHHGTEWYDTTERNASEVHAFIDGPWVAELKSLASEVKAHEAAHSARRAKEHREDPARLADLKKRFGL